MKSELNNYRGITLLSMLGKLLVGVINNRLWEVVDRFDILREIKLDFDMVIEQHRSYFYAENNYKSLCSKKKQNKPLFLCFVDFRKAFDKVNHKLP